MAKDKENVIIWQKWIDPFGEDELSDIMSSKHLDDNSENEPEFYNDDESQEKLSDSSGSENQDMQMQSFKKYIKVMNTPMGIIPVTENTASGKIFNFWLGHSNFNITKKIALLIEETEGVETLDIFTRYRFRISIGKAFRDSDVMRNINNNVYAAME